MSAINEGGPAFPIPHSGEPGSYEAHPGMSLRDHFAGQALAGNLPSLTMIDEKKAAALAKGIWLIADAMIAARTVSPSRDEVENGR